MLTAPGRICTKCKEYKTAENFSPEPKVKSGLRAHCKPCAVLMTKEWHRNNRERSNEWKRDNYNPAKGKAAYERRKATISPEQKARDKENVKRWQQENKEPQRPYKAMKVMERNAAKLQATPTWADEAKIQEYYFAADFLGMVTGIWHNVDHIVPLQSKLVCGLHWEGNLQVITKTENVTKGNRHWPNMPE